MKKKNLEPILSYVAARGGESIRKELRKAKKKFRGNHNILGACEEALFHIKEIEGYAKSLKGIMDDIHEAQVNKTAPKNILEMTKGRLGKWDFCDIRRGLGCRRYKWYLPPNETTGKKEAAFRKLAKKLGFTGRIEFTHNPKPTCAYRRIGRSYLAIYIPLE